MNWIVLLLALAGSGPGSVECSASLDLELGWSGTGDLEVTASIRNFGDTEITLVQPGHGSDQGRRTPLIGWQTQDANGTLVESDLLAMSCGNISPLGRHEVFRLAPGKSLELHPGWLRRPFVPAEGAHRVRLLYENEPDLLWKGIPLRSHDEAEMERVRNSTPCRLVSAWVDVPPR